MKILIVDDDDRTRVAMGRLLRRAGADVTTAADGGEALGHMLDTQFDVLVTDLHMPEAGVDGFALLDQCQSLPLTQRPRRTVAISGEYERTALEVLGPGKPGVDFFPKPVNLDQLLDHIGGRPN